MSASYALASSRPHVKDSCGSNLQLAFSEGRWNTVITLAKQASKSTKDSYYEAVEVAARSQLDTQADQLAGMVAVDRMIAEKTIIKDPNVMDLLDFACARVDKDYSKTLGALRAGLVKALPTNKDAAKVAFYACVTNDDWENSQQIMAIMDKHYPKDSRYLFSNILACHILSTKLSGIDSKRAAMFRMLAQRLIDKARELRDSTPESMDYPPRAIVTEEEMRLWLRIQTDSMTSETEILTLLHKPQFSALSHLSQGHLSVFKEIMSLLKEHKIWDEIYKISREVFEKGIVLLTKDKQPDTRRTVDLSAEESKRLEKIKEFTSTRAEELAQAKADAETRAFSSAVMDWSLWTHFIGAANHHKEGKKALKQLRTYISKLSKVIAIRPIHRKQMDLANLMILFGRSHSSTENMDGEASDSTSKTRIDHLVAYINTHYQLVSCFDDLKPFLEDVSFQEINNLLVRMGQEGQKKDNDTFKNIMILVFRLRFRYLFVTSARSVAVRPDTSIPECRFCASAVHGSICQKCLETIAKSCAWMYNNGVERDDLQERMKTEDVDPFADLAIIGSTCLIKMSGLSCDWQSARSMPIQDVNVKLVLQAIAWSNAHYTNQTKKAQSMPVFLTKLYLLIGCVSHANVIWETLGVKNITLDSLGPLFFDRSSSIAPGQWESLPGPMYGFTKHYMDSIRRSIPSGLRNSLEHGNYTSVVGLREVQSRLSRSCTMVMAAVENRRGVRATSGRVGSLIKDDPLLRTISDDVILVDATDHASMPDHESAPSTLHDVISIGPGLSDTRTKLSLLAEKFIDLVSLREAKELKPSKPAQAAKIDRSYTAEAASQIEMPILRYLLPCLEEGQAPTKLTGPELAYYSVIQALVTLIALTMGVDWTKNTPRPAATDLAVSHAVAVLKKQIELLSKVPGGAPAKTIDIYSFATLHAMGMLRETTQAVKLTVIFMERAALPFKSDVPKWLTQYLQALNTAFTDSTAFLKKRIKALNDAAFSDGCLDGISEYAFGDLATGAKSVNYEFWLGLEIAEGDMEEIIFKVAGEKVGLEHTFGEIADSWRQVAKGWASLKLD
ncbi:N-acetyltransferase B complex non catalytic subunit-domain-containing protein [Xylariales sp. AK1849]|nr:N-acetyltransferase B complex non catalytic subunit-domain-containing protein [Xylariales sp. AK1849]